MSARWSHDTNAFSMLVGDIYDASLDPSLWPPVLERSANFVRGVASALIVRDPVHKTQNNICTWGYDPDYTQIYLEKFIPFDPFTTGQFFFDIEEPVAVADIMPHVEFRGSRFYKEWVRPQGWIDAIGATLDRSATSYAAFFVIRHKRNGIVDNETRRRMKLVVPHVRRAVLIGNVINLCKVEAAALADTLDGLAAAMFLIDSDSRIMHANAAGHVMLSDGSVICAVGGKLTVADQALSGSLVDAGSEDVTLGRKGGCLPLRSRNGDDYVAHVLSLTAGNRRLAGAAYSAVAAMFVCKAAIELPHPMEALAKRYRLTAAEMRVLFAIVEIGGVPEVARMLGISEATVKTHLQRVFGKTDTARQADLVKLVAGFAGPFG